MRAALGLNDGYNSSAALMVDGTVVACAQEERFTRVKNQSGYPRLAVEYCLAHPRWRLNLQTHKFLGIP